jgi:hypothetical protein
MQKYRVQTPRRASFVPPSPLPSPRVPRPKRGLSRLTKKKVDMPPARTGGGDEVAVGPSVPRPATGPPDTAAEAPRRNGRRRALCLEKRPAGATHGRASPRPRDGLTRRRGGRKASVSGGGDRCRILYMPLSPQRADGRTSSPSKAVSNRAALPASPSIGNTEAGESGRGEEKTREREERKRKTHRRKLPTDELRCAGPSLRNRRRTNCGRRCRLGRASCTTRNHHQVPPRVSCRDALAVLKPWIGRPRAAPIRQACYPGDVTRHSAEAPSTAGGFIVSSSGMRAKTKEAGHRYRSAVKGIPVQPRRPSPSYLVRPCWGGSQRHITARYIPLPARTKAVPQPARKGFPTKKKKKPFETNVSLRHTA